uniref:Amino acid transporter transmembrane domain-containing protein n=1 Tax=Zooxanthella nutricula TaxID=1333877 RepID=A0A7S2VQT0_9DINO
MVVNLYKNIVGATVLSLAAGTAAFSDSPGAVVPASVVTLAVAAACAYSFTLIARSCELTGTDTFRGAWVKTLGAKSAWIISAANTLMAGAGCLQYVVVLTDAGTSLAAAAGAPPLLASRSVVLLSIMGLVLLPLSFLESCKQLQYTSAFGIAGVLYYIAAMVLRFAQGAYAPGGALHRAIAPALRPSFGATGGSFWSPKALVLVSMLNTAYVCHYNAPKFYRELEARSIPRFAVLACLGFGLSGLLYVVGLSASFLTFGGHSAGFIFNNYAASDTLFVIARVMVSFVMLCTYPLLFVAFRDGASELLPKEGQGQGPQLSRSRLTFALVGVLAACALAIKDVSVIVSVPGALIGSAIVYVFPNLVFLRATRGARGRGLERALCRGLVALGALFASLGTGSSLGLFGA